MIRFVIGACVALGSVGALAVACHHLRRRLLGSLRGADACLAEVALVLVVVVVGAEILGTVGAFHTAPVVIVLVLSAIGIEVVGRRLGPADDPPVPAPRPSTSDLVVTAIGLAALAGAWLARTIGALRGGMVTPDSLWYHLPVAARFVQTGRVTSAHFLDSESVTAYYPATSSLLHGVGLLLFDTDLVSVVVNLGWLALCLVAAWSIGSRFAVAPATTLAVGVVCAFPGMVETQPGGAYNDIAGIALILTAIALHLAPRPASGPLVRDILAGATAGLAVGMKFTFVVPAVVLVLIMVVRDWRPSRAHTLGIVAAATITGGYWYARNLLLTGNPLPSLDVHLGPIGFDALPSSTPSSSVSQYLTKADAWQDYFLPGFRAAIGPVWPVVVLVVAVGVVASLVQRKDVSLRVVGLIALISLASFVFMPQFLAIGDKPVYFEVNMRYAFIGLAIGVTVVPAALHRHRRLVLAVVLVTLLVTLVDPTSWPTGLPWHAFQGDRARGLDAALATGAMAVAVAVAAIAWALRRRVTTARWNVAVAFGVPLLLLISLAAVQPRYEDGRYADVRSGYTGLDAWFRSVADARVTTVGLFMQLQYPLYGLDVSNHVQFAGVPAGHGGRRAIRTCREWVRALERGRYDYAVIGPSQGFERWTRTQPDAELVYSERLGSGGETSVDVFSLNRRRTDRRC